jgi:predicted phage terminase large subunit-like protein
LTLSQFQRSQYQILLSKAQHRKGATTAGATVPEPTALSFVDWVRMVEPTYQFYEHAQRLADALQAVADGECQRLMVFMPPRHGKTLLASKLFPAYYLHRHPSRHVGVASYSSALAYSISRACRGYYSRSGGALADDSSAVSQWHTAADGSLFATGVGGSQTGRGFHLGLIDDPLKNAEQAGSQTIKDKHREWWGSTWYTRCEPGGAIVVIQTRWAEDDLSGWLLEQEADDPHPQGWRIISLPALAEPMPLFPSSCSVEDDWRDPGQPLCPERFDVPELERIRSQLGPYFWNALYQQRPAPLEGALFRRDWWQTYDYSGLPSMERIIASWDLTFKANADSDFVAGIVIGQHGQNFYVMDAVCERLDINGTLAAIARMNERWEPQATLIEEAANGAAVLGLMRDRIPGLVAVKPEGGKISRAQAIAPRVEAGQVWLPRTASWLADWASHFDPFPRGRNDDLVDALSQAVTYCARDMWATNWFGNI